MGSVGLVENLTAFILETSARQAVDIRFLGRKLQQAVDVVVRYGVSSHWLMRPGPPRAFRADGCQVSYSKELPFLSSNDSVREQCTSPAILPAELSADCDVPFQSE